jgi:hypothetical protein
MSEEEEFHKLRSRILECICKRIESNEPDWFCGVDMIKRCTRAFLDKLGIDEYHFSGKHLFYQLVHDEIYQPLVDAGLMVENENNTFTIPPDSLLRNICSKQLTKDESYILWNECMEDVRRQRVQDTQ